MKRADLSLIYLDKLDPNNAYRNPRRKSEIKIVPNGALLANNDAKINCAPPENTNTDTTKSL